MPCVQNAQVIMLKWKLCRYYRGKARPENKTNPKHQNKTQNTNNKGNKNTKPPSKQKTRRVSALYIKVKHCETRELRQLAFLGLEVIFFHICSVDGVSAFCTWRKHLQISFSQAYAFIGHDHSVDHVLRTSAKMPPMPTPSG